MNNASIRVPVPAKKSRRQEARNWAWGGGIALLIVSGAAWAGDADALGGGICQLVTVLTGKWLFGFAILATLGAGGALLFGAEMTDGIKKLATIITVVGLILGMSGLLTLAFSSYAGTSFSCASTT